ncbi:MAG: RES family NAD+ phosphorylase [Hyphomicrobiales bacterium]
MRLWRISNYADLSGKGGLQFSARWHTRGRPIVYTAEHPALALLEVMVQPNIDTLPDTYQLLEIIAPEDIKVEVAEPKEGWEADIAYSRQLGDAWLAASRSALLMVPSAVVPRALNALINPRHPESSRIVVFRAETYARDKRLK